jgi:hypothetical protein
MPASVRVILKPLGLPGVSTLENVASARLGLVRNGTDGTLGAAAAQAAELTFSLVTIEKIRTGSPSAPQPLAKLVGTLKLEGDGRAPRFDTLGGEAVPLVTPAPPADPQSNAPAQRRSVVIELDPSVFGERPPLTLALPSFAAAVTTLEIAVDLKIAGSVESPLELNDRFDFPARGPQPIRLIKIVSLEFMNDHNAMADNAADFSRTGNAIPRPHWTFGKPSHPVSFTKNERMNVRVVLECHPFNADEVDCEMEGRADFGAVFRLNNDTARLKGGLNTRSFRSEKPLQDEINKLVGEIAWKVKVKDPDEPQPRELDAGRSFGHVVYLTFGPPQSPPGRERGITVKRMEAAVAMLHDTGTLVIHDMIQRVNKKHFPAFTLDGDPTLPAAFDHPGYFNDDGGAWRILETPRKEAHCQALVRLMLAICRVAGMPGKLETRSAFADPDTGVPKDEPMGAGIEGGLSGIKRKVGSQDVEPFLNSRPFGKVGQTFVLGDDKAPDLNVFEACLSVTDDSGITKIHPGGTGGTTFDNINDVVPITFVSLIWVRRFPFDPSDPNKDRKARLERIVKTYP